jgi:hypothetical protein
MIDLDTFLTTLYVMSDDFYKSYAPEPPPPPGRPASLSAGEVMTLAVMSQWYWFRSQRDFYRYACRRWRGYFPNMPDRSQFNRLVNTHRDAIAAFSLFLVEQRDGQATPYEILDTTGVPTRNVKRRGAGWLTGLTNIGWCTRLGWFQGFRLLLSSTREGWITGFGFGAASAKEQPMTEVFLALRAQPNPRFPSIGLPARGGYLADAGFTGKENHHRWKTRYGAIVICEPQAHAPPWPKPWKLWLHHLREVVESVFDKLLNFFRLEDDRPHELAGFQANLAAKVALHNFCIWLNYQLDRPPLAFADLVLR